MRARHFYRLFSLPLPLNGFDTLLVQNPALVFTVSPFALLDRGSLASLDPSNRQRGNSGGFFSRLKEYADFVKGRAGRASHLLFLLFLFFFFFLSLLSPCAAGALSLTLFRKVFLCFFLLERGFGGFPEFLCAILPSLLLSTQGSCDRRILFAIVATR